MIAVSLLVGAAVVVGIAIALPGGGDGYSGEPATSMTSTVPAGALESAFADDAILGRVRAAAEALEATGTHPDPETVCATVAADLDKVGTIAEVADEATELPDVEVTEAALEQQAAVSSVFAACRGDAPVPVKEAAAELVESNVALDAVLEERGVE